MQFGHIKHFNDIKQTLKIEIYMKVYKHIYTHMDLSIHTYSDNLSISLSGGRYVCLYEIPAEHAIYARDDQPSYTSASFPLAALERKTSA